MKIKKIVILALTLTISMSFLTSCSDDKGNDIKNQGVSQFSSQNYDITIQMEEAWRPYYEVIVGEVTSKYPDKTVNFVDTPSLTNLDLIYATSIDNKDIPDIFAVPYNKINGLIEDKCLSPIDVEAIAQISGSNKVFDDNLKSAGTYYGVPYFMETAAVFINVKNAADKNVSIIDAVEFNDFNVNSILSTMHDLNNGINFLNSVYLTPLKKDENGVYSSDLTKNFAELSTEQVKLLNVMFNYWNTNKEANPDIWDSEASFNYMNEHFSTGGKSFLRLDTTNNLTDIIKVTNNGEDLMVLPTNAFTVYGNSLKSIKNGYSLVVNRNTQSDQENMQIVNEIIAELTNPNNALNFFNDSKKILSSAEYYIFEQSMLEDHLKSIINASITSYDSSISYPLEEFELAIDTWKNALILWQTANPVDTEAAYEIIQGGFNSLIETLNS